MHALSQGESFELVEERLPSFIGACPNASNKKELKELESAVKSYVEKQLAKIGSIEEQIHQQFNAGQDLSELFELRGEMIARNKLFEADVKVMRDKLHSLVEINSRLLPCGRISMHFDWTDLDATLADISKDPLGICKQLDKQDACKTNFSALQEKIILLSEKDAFDLHTGHLPAAKPKIMNTALQYMLGMTTDFYSFLPSHFKLRKVENWTDESVREFQELPEEMISYDIKRAAACFFHRKLADLEADLDLLERMKDLHTLHDTVQKTQTSYFSAAEQLFENNHRILELMGRGHFSRNFKPELTTSEKLSNSRDGVGTQLASLLHVWNIFRERLSFQDLKIDEQTLPTIERRYQILSDQIPPIEFQNATGLPPPEEEPDPLYHTFMKYWGYETPQ
ncbi:MAG: hypothetical protein JSS61_03135 [Verrucomicrobia bacterium]|nr:hypothetical protein [Verrucomicrobiota bacterium]